MEAHEEARVGRAVEGLFKLGRKGARTRALATPALETLAGIGTGVVLIYGGSQVIGGHNTPGAFFSFIAAVLLAYEPAKRLAKLHIELNSALVGVTMLFEFLDQQEVEDDASSAQALQVSQGQIALRDLTFSYREEEAVLNGLSFVAEGGKTTALVGQSGGGKSTVMAMLLRFYEPAGGTIEIDGQDIRQVTRESLRRSIAYVSQETFLFHGTIRENIAIGKPDATEAEIIAAAKAAHAHDFIMGFEKGYETNCGEQGLQLSGGQRQRISIARAFLKNAPILLLDEATSALDNESERAVQAALAALQTGRTTIVIAHRLSTIRNAEKICVVVGGRVVEEGGHNNLISTNGFYARLADQLNKGHL